MKFENLDSSLFITENLKLYCLSNSWTYPYTHDIPIYTVSPETIDKICPPERNKGIDPKCFEKIKSTINEIMHERILDEEEFDRINDKLNSVISECTRIFPVDGVFVAKNVNLELEKEISTPAIFICPERIYESAKSIAESVGVSHKKAFKYLLRSVIIHEQNHAYTWKYSNGFSFRNYHQYHIKILEEFSAQLTAYSHMSTLGKIIFIEKSKKQPLEYQTWRTFPIETKLDSMKIALTLTEIYKGVVPLVFKKFFWYYDCFRWWRIHRHVFDLPPFPVFRRISLHILEHQYNLLKFLAILLLYML